MTDLDKDKQENAGPPLKRVKVTFRQQLTPGQIAMGHHPLVVAEYDVVSFLTDSKWLMLVFPDKVVKHRLDKIDSFEYPINPPSGWRLQDRFGPVRSEY